MDNRRNGPTAAELKEGISGSRKAGKVNAFDPAAAPLGTDDEAAGTSPGHDGIDVAHDRERSGRRDDDHAISAQPGRHWRPYAIYLTGAAIVLIALASLLTAWR